VLESGRPPARAHAFAVGRRCGAARPQGDTAAARAQAHGPTPDGAALPYPIPGSAASTATPASSGADTVSISSTGRAGAASAQPSWGPRPWSGSAPARASGPGGDPVRRLSALLSGDEEPPAPDGSPGITQEPSSPGVLPGAGGTAARAAQAPLGAQPAAAPDAGEPWRGAAAPAAAAAHAAPFREVGNVVRAGRAPAGAAPARNASGGPGPAGGPRGFDEDAENAVADAWAASPGASAGAGKAGVHGPAGRRLSGGGVRRAKHRDPQDLSPTEAAIRAGLRRSSRLRAPAEAGAR